MSARAVSRAFAVAAVLAIASLGVLSACRTIFQRPGVEFRGIVIDSFDSSGAMIEAAFDVDNPNSYRLSIQRLTYKIRIEGFEAGHGEESSTTLLPGKTVTPVRLPLTVDWSKMRSLAWSALYGHPIAYDVEGDITFSTPAGTFTRPYKHSGVYSPFAKGPTILPGAH